jgi:hypothetical protein
LRRLEKICQQCLSLIRNSGGLHLLLTPLRLRSGRIVARSSSRLQLLLSLLRLDNIALNWCFSRLELVLPAMRLASIVNGSGLDWFDLLLLRLWRQGNIIEWWLPSISIWLRWSTLLLLRILSPYRLALTSLIQDNRPVHDKELLRLAVFTWLRTGQIAFKLDLHQPSQFIFVKCGIEWLNLGIRSLLVSNRWPSPHDSSSTSRIVSLDVGGLEDKLAVAKEKILRGSHFPSPDKLSSGAGQCCFGHHQRTAGDHPLALGPGRAFRRPSEHGQCTGNFGHRHSHAIADHLSLVQVVQALGKVEPKLGVDELGAQLGLGRSPPHAKDRSFLRGNRWIIDGEARLIPDRLLTKRARTT